MTLVALLMDLLVIVKSTYQNVVMVDSIFYFCIQDVANIKVAKLVHFIVSLKTHSGFKDGIFRGFVLQFE